MPPQRWCGTTPQQFKNRLCSECCFATNRSCTPCKNYRLHCTHSSLIVHLLSSKGRSCSLDSRNLGYNNKPHIRPAQSHRLFKDTVGCTFFPLNEAPTLPLCYILETDAVGCDAQLISVDRAFFVELPLRRYWTKSAHYGDWKTAIFGQNCYSPQSERLENDNMWHQNAATEQKDFYL